MSNIKHSFVSIVPDNSNPNEVQGSDWNAPHVLDPPVNGLLYDADGSGNIFGLRTVGLLQDQFGTGAITPVRVRGLLNDPLGDGNIVGVQVSGIVADPDGDGNYQGIKVTGLWNDDGNGNISGVRHRGLLMDKAGNGVYSGVDVAGVYINPSGNNEVVGVSAAFEGQFLRRKYNALFPEYEFAPVTRFVSKDFDFVTGTYPLTSLVIGSNVFTALVRLPAGVNGSSPNKHYVEIVDAVAGNETVLLTAVNEALLQVTFTCTKAHAAGDYSFKSATAGIQEAIHGFWGAPGGYISIPQGTHVITGTIFVSNITSTPMTIEGSGEWSTTLVRGVGWTTQHFFTYSATNPSKFTLTGMRILNGQNSTLAYISVSARAINLASSNCTIQDVVVYNGSGGIEITQASNITLERFSFIQEVAFTPIQQSTSGIFLQGGSSILINNCTLTGMDVTHANYLIFGINISEVNGLIITNCRISAVDGILLNGFANFVLANIYIGNCHLFNIKSTGIALDGTTSIVPYTQIQINNCQIHGHDSLNTNVGVALNGAADYVTIINNLIHDFGTHGIYVNGINNWQSIPRRSVIISENEVYACNITVTAGGSAIYCTAAIAGLVITNNILFNKPGTGDIKFGITFDTSVNSTIVTGNKISNITGPIAVNTVGTSVICKDNLGVDDVVKTVASAATINIGMNSIILITGTVPISKIDPVWPGRQITFIWGDAAPGGVAWSPTGNVITSHTGTANNTLSLTYNAPWWF